MNGDEHYLKRELYDLIKRDRSVFDFFHEGSLDGIWYWDLNSPENEWMSPEFWRLLGFDSNEKKHLASEWKDLIFESDLTRAVVNFTKHCENPQHDYDQVVRYRHKDGSTVWVRCRGIAIRDSAGKPIRMLGAHTDITAQKRAEEELALKNIELNARNQELESLLSKLESSEQLLRATIRKLEDALSESSNSMRVLHDEILRRTAAESEALHSNRLLSCLDQLRKQFIEEQDPLVLFSQFLETFLELTNSEFGFVADVISNDNGRRCLKVHAINNLACNEETNNLYLKLTERLLESKNLDNLFGSVVISGEPVIENDPEIDTLISGFPEGQLVLSSFMGIPIYYGNQLVGEVGIANRPGGYDEGFLQSLSPVISGLGQIIMARWETEARAIAEKKLTLLASTDPLTGLMNRREFKKHVQGSISRKSRYSEESILLMLDIDHFKAVNDEFGHDIGDQVLVQLAEHLQSHLRDVDTIARWGGEEFIILLPRTTIKQGKALAERIRAHIETASFMQPEHITISFGLTSVRGDEKMEHLVNRADKALYTAKRRGRNNVVTG